MDTPRVLEFRDDMDIVAKRWIERELGQMERLGDDDFAILDLTNVRYLDTTFLNALLRARSRLAKQKPNFRMCLVAPRSSIVRLLFEITKLDAVFFFFDDLQSARQGSSRAFALVSAASA